MKRSISILLLALFLFNYIGYYSLFLVFEHQNRQTQFFYIQNNLNIEKLVIHKSELQTIVFKDQGKEILFNEEMYDIKFRHEDGDFIVFHCVKDKKEKLLNKQLNVQVLNNSKNKADSKSELAAKKIINDLYTKNFETLIAPTREASYPVLLCNWVGFLDDNRLSPPPKHFLFS